ncbi:MAG: 6-phospho-beta-glucosidase [Actinomycetota bacterium]|nr:6-phospho-beta-glucosidase [Actinomycetota bacterium]MDQ2956530.1 6-phospho-beta-glucosidase [Actinomycetota bacterium]
MKIAVVGGGSTYTPELVAGFAKRAEVLEVDELVLHDIDAERLEVVGGLASRILGAQGYPGTVRTTTVLPDALDGAASVLIQLRVGGQQTRLRDETIPGRYGLIGQETTGPGGFAKALRTVPVVLGIAEATAKYADPEAWIVDFTNPVGIVTRALLDEGHRALGLCNVAIGFQRRFAQHFGVSPEQVDLDHAGLNHLTWLRGVQVAGVEKLSEILDSDYAIELSEALGAPLELMRALRAIPSYYLHYFYCTDEVVAAQRTGEHRAERVLAIEKELLELYRDPALDHKPELLDSRGGAYYSEAAAALVTSLLTGDGARHYVNLRNDATIAGLAADAVVEVPALVDRAGAHPVPVAPLRPELLGLVQDVTQYEQLTIAAAKSGDRRLAALALLANPLVRQWDRIPPLLADLIAENADFLPQFSVDTGRRG